MVYAGGSSIVSGRYLKIVHSEVTESRVNLFKLVLFVMYFLA